MHIPVLLHETITWLRPKEGGTYVDCTVNRAGHSKEIAKIIGPKGTLIIFDLDSRALSEAKAILEKLPQAPKIIPVHANFRTLTTVLKEHAIDHIDGLIADLGLSSQELDSSGRGFTFRFDEPLLMTFNDQVDEKTLTAKDIVNTWQEESIADILFGFADERYSRRIARAIVAYREDKEISSTQELVDIISRAIPMTYRHARTHFATKTFQALRMAVNDELRSIEDLINALPNCLIKEGRACIITFHSTEDRIVKNLIRSQEQLTLVSKKAIIPTEEEIKHNPRARSAQLRIAERV
jgi:16S rRNA (cytosine1402-N4)-methyltransferase